MTDYRHRSIALLKSIETGDVTPRSYLNHDYYIQHNIALADGVEPVFALFDAIRPGQGKANTVRAFQDGDMVFLHTEFDLFGHKTAIDIHRYTDGLIVEHWDNLQITPAHRNPSGRSMVDGETAIADLDKTAENKGLIRHFLEDAVIAGDGHAASSFFNEGMLIQHNPYLADGVAPFLEYLGLLGAKGAGARYERLHMVLGEGNFVLSLCEGVASGNSSAFFDLFRIARGKIVEHWDVVHEIPPVAEHKNSNGKF